jgi:hypothetical protein
MKHGRTIKASELIKGQVVRMVMGQGDAGNADDFNQGYSALTVKRVDASAGALLHRPYLLTPDEWDNGQGVCGLGVETFSVWLGSSAKFEVLQDVEVR